MKKLLQLLIILLLIGSASYSQELIELNTAVKTAMKNNPDIKLLESNLEIQKLNIQNRKGELYPTLSLSSGWSRNNTFSKGGVIIQNGIPIFIGDQSRWENNFFAGLSSQVILYNGFANYESVELERQNEASIKINLEKIKYDLVINVYTKYFDVLKKEQIVRINEDNLVNAQNQLGKIKEYVKIGVKRESEIYKQDAQVAQYELDLEKSKNDLSKSKVELLASMYDDINKDINVTSAGLEISFNIVDLEKIKLSYSDANALTKQALENRYDYKLILQEIKINETKLDIAKKNLYFPTISAFGNYNISGRQIDDIANNRVLTIGLSLNYSIFQGFKLDINKQVAEVNVKQKKDEMDKIKYQIHTDIKKAIIDLETSFKQIEIIDRNIKAAEQDKILSEENFRIGYGTLLDVQTATTRYNNLLIERINAVYNFYLAKIQIDYLTGKLKYK
ncbi:MAG: TolC family protein [Ignavibacteria bacterium]|nr:TolC family protein [Ignavibacteria bacterium]